MATFRQYMRFMSKTLTIKILPIMGICVLTLLSSALLIYFAYLSKNIIDNVFVKLDLPYLLSYIPLLVIAYLSYSALEIITIYVSARWKVKLDFELKCKFYSKMNSINYENLSNYSPADMYYRMFNDGSTMSRYLYAIAVTIPCNVIFCIAVFTIMLSWSWQLTLFSLILIGIQFLNIIIFKKPIVIINTIQRRVDQSVANFVLEKLGLLDFAKTLGIGRWWNQETESRFNEAKSATIKNTFLMTIFTQFSSLLQQFWSLGLLIFGAVLIINGQITIGLFFGFQSMITSFVNPLTKLVSDIFSFQDTKVAFNRYLEYYDLPEINEEVGIDFSFTDALSFKDVCFSYKQKSNIILEKFTARFEIGSIIALVGESGVGKTTLMKLVARLHSIDSGTIYLDDTPIQDINYHSYIKNVSFMLQKAEIFNDTLINNLTLGREVTALEIEEIIDKCKLRKVIERLPDGKESLIGVNGTELSTGEMQRISLARVLLKRPKILWLDEPTSSLDKESEEMIINTLIEYKKETKSLIIINTHRPYVLQYVDSIVEIKREGQPCSNEVDIVINQ